MVYVPNPDAIATVRERVYRILVDAAREGKPAPAARHMREEIGCHMATLNLALTALEEDGRIQREGTPSKRAYRIVDLGVATAPLRRDRPGQWTLKRPDTALTALQREALSVARLLIRRNGDVGTPELARELGVCTGKAQTRLIAIAKRGHLREVDGFRYVLAEPKTTAIPSGPRVENRPEFPVPVQVCPPAYAKGALIFGTMLGHGGIALAGGGYQKVARRP